MNENKVAHSPCIILFITGGIFCFLVNGLLAKVEIKATVQKKNIKTGEPILLKVTLNNKGSEVEYFSFFGKETFTNFVNLGWLQANQEPVWHGMRPPGKIDHLREKYSLESGEKKVEKFIILYNDRIGKYIFKRSKQHRIEVHYSGHRKSNPVKFQIKKPQSGDDKTVWKKYLKKTHRRKYGRLIHVPWQLETKYSVSAEDRAFFYDLIEKYPDSTYTPYITFSLGRNYSALSTLEQKDTERYKKKAKEMFRKTLDLTDNQLLEEFTRDELEKLNKGLIDEIKIWVGEDEDENSYLLISIVTLCFGGLIFLSLFNLWGPQDTK